MAVCGTFVQPLDLECIFVNMLSGDWIIFSVLALAFIISLAGTFRMSNIVTGASVFLFGVVFFGQMPWIMYISIMFGGVLIWGMVSWIKR